MATPFKRICLRATQISRQQHQQWRTISTTRPFQADALTTTDPDLDSLTRQPGVQYTLTEEPDKDLGKYAPEGLSSLAHRELEQHRELREMVRLAAWEMPLLASLAKPYARPRKEQVLRWRYTTYMGEAHPAARKVVVTFDPQELPGVSEKQRQKLLKLAGARYNPTTSQIKMSCEAFETMAQNKRFLADTINKLVAEAKDPKADTFEDVPLDLRHHRKPVRHKFPREWAMTSERRMQLEGRRKQLLIEEAKKVERDEVVDGMGAIARANAEGDKRREEEEMVMIESRKQPDRRGGRR